MRTFRLMSVRIRLARCSRAAMWCALSLCAMPLNAHAQQSPSVPVLRAVPLIGLLFTTPPIAKAPVAKVPVLSDLPIIGRLYRVEPKTPAQPKVAGSQDSSGQIVSLEAKSATLGQVIELLMDQAHLSYTLDPTLEKIPVGSLKLRKVPFEIALRTLLKSAAGRATYTFEDGIYRILPHENLDVEHHNSVVPNPAIPVVPAGDDAKAGVEVSDTPFLDAGKKVNLELDNVPLSLALKLLFAQAKINHTIVVDPTLLNGHITAHLKNLDARSALEQLLKSAGTGFTYRVDNGVYQIVARPKDNPEGAKP